jgi:hypothetical protein
MYCFKMPVGCGKSCGVVQAEQLPADRTIGQRVGCAGQPGLCCKVLGPSRHNASDLWVFWHPFFAMLP